MSTHCNTGSQQPMRRGRIARVVSAIGTAALVGSLAALAACTDAPSAPGTPLAPSRSLITTLGTTLDAAIRVDALTRNVPLEKSITRSWRIRRSTGGTIDWPEVGLKVAVPSNAFSAKEMTITVTALAGDVVAYDFGPDGTVFALPLEVSQDLKQTSWYKLGAGATLRGAYFKSASLVDDVTNTALVSAFENSEVDVGDSKLKFTVTHFSGYMVSMD